MTGTDSATEQAATVMDSYAERQARVNQKIEDTIKKSILACEDIVDDACEEIIDEVKDLYIDQADELLEGQMRILKKWRDINGKE